MDKENKQETSKPVRDVFRVSTKWVDPNGVVIPVFASPESANNYSHSHRLDSEVDYEKPWEISVQSYGRAAQKGYYESTPDDFKIPKGFESLGAVVAAEGRTGFIAYFFSDGDVGTYSKLKGNMITKYIVPVLELEDIENE